MFGSKRARILISLLSTMFVVFSSLMFFQNLSVGNADNNPGIPDDNTPSEQTHEPAQETEPPDETPQPHELQLTNNQRYFEPLVSPNSINVMITGSDVVGWNFDTIMILSIDKDNKAIRMISFPRDIYIDYSDFVKDELRKKKPSYLTEKGIEKINAAPAIGNAIEYKKNVGRFQKPYIDFLCDLIEEIFGIHIDDYAYVKVQGVRNIVDYFGGVWINVPILMNYVDPVQNLDIYIEPGYQRLNGKQAEGFLRFRQGLDEHGVMINHGDIYRKKNQIAFMQEFIKQKVTLSNLARINEIAEMIQRNIITSVTDLETIISYGALAEEAVRNEYVMESVDIKFEDKRINGLEYIVIKQAETGS
ncbi:MAG TPA: LCP family protein [Thermoclostridium sp.]|nr:LCP family protein [Clostridiaceae bacterium]HOQ76553.1 LCP family protein [Thermoclostridium sp.]HPU44847.1 LCP family protein [Thermoclostridium sp.]